MKASKRKTYYVVQAFTEGPDGPYPDSPREVPNEIAARAWLDRLRSVKAGAIAFSRTGDPDLGEFDDAVIIAQFGDVPLDVADLTGA